MMRPLLLATAVSLLPGAALAVDKHAAHQELTYWMVRADVDWSRPDDGGLFTWEGDAWIGGDVNKLWLRSEGESLDGEVEGAWAELLYSRNVATYWDLQAGVRQDFEPVSATSLAIGVQGLAPYQFETEAFAYLSEDGDLGFRASQAIDLHLTQRLILEPEIEAELSAGDVPERGLGAGLTEIGASIQLRYEITRKFAPYVELNHERLLGDTADIAEAAGHDTEETTVRLGVRAWF